MASKYKIVFRGDIVPGHAMADVRERLQDLFRLDDAAIAKLFSGRPVAIRKNLDEATACKWCEVLEKAGAIAEAVADESAPADTGAPHPESSDTGETPVYGLQVEPVGADVLKPSERTPAAEQEIAVPELSVDEVGADVLRENERRAFVELELDLSHLTLEDIAAE